MSILENIAFYKGERSEVPNQELAKKLVMDNDQYGMDEIAKHLYDKNQSVASDCLKVLYEAGYINPQITSKYVEDFIKLLYSRNNRMVWGAMIAISNITTIVPNRVFDNIDRIIYLTEKGTVITHIHGINVMLKLCQMSPEYYERLYPILIGYLKSCRPIDLGKRIILYTELINDDNVNEIISVIYSRASDINQSQLPKVRSALKKKGIIVDL